MNALHPARAEVPLARRIIIELETRVLIDADGRPARKRIAEVAATVTGLCANGREVVLVSSGAVEALKHCSGSLLAGGVAEPRWHPGRSPPGPADGQPEGPRKGS